jgi:hypothetical protein
MKLVGKRKHVLLLSGVLLLFVAAACSLPGATSTGPQGPEETGPTTPAAVSTTAPADTPVGAKPTPEPTQAPSAGLLRQWATGAMASSEYGSADYSAQQATGAPNTTECGDIETAWASEASDGVDWLEVSFSTAVVPTEISIRETYSPGFINKVEVRDEAGLSYTVWEGTPAAVEECPRVLTVSVSGVNARVNAVRINLDQRDGGNWNEIDAVELVGQP